MAVDSITERIDLCHDACQAESGDVGQEQRSLPTARLADSNDTQREGGDGKDNLGHDVANWRVGSRSAVTVDARRSFGSFPVMHSTVQQKLAQQNGC